jgi:hypothetical protein
MKLMLLLAVFLICFNGYVTETYYMPSAEHVGDKTGYLPGELSFTYETGGVEWRGPVKKFKKVWGVTFEPNFYVGRFTVLSYDRTTYKVKAVDIATQAEVPNNTIITNTYFFIKGRR